MPNNKQAIKRTRQAEAANLRNKSDRSKMRTTIKKLLQSISEKNLTAAKVLFSQTQKVLDTLAKKNVIAANTASRYKKRLNSKVKAIAE